MKIEIKNIINKYNGFSDFMRNATDEDKKIVFEEAVQKANEDQRRVVEKNKTEECCEKCIDPEVSASAPCRYDGDCSCHTTPNKTEEYVEEFAPNNINN